MRVQPILRFQGHVKFNLGNIEKEMHILLLKRDISVDPDDQKENLF